MMSNELAGIFTCFIFGLIFTFVSWRAWTRKEITYRGRRYRRADSPFEFWLYTTMVTLSAVFAFLFGIYLSIHLLRSSWRTVNSGGEGSSRSLTFSYRPPLPDILKHAPNREDQDDPPPLLIPTLTQIPLQALQQTPHHSHAAQTSPA